MLGVGSMLNEKAKFWPWT